MSVLGAGGNITSPITLHYPASLQVSMPVFSAHSAGRSHSRGLVLCAITAVQVPQEEKPHPLLLSAQRPEIEPFPLKENITGRFIATTSFTKEPRLSCQTLVPFTQITECLFHVKGAFLGYFFTYFPIKNIKKRMQSQFALFSVNHLGFLHIKVSSLV